VPSRQEVIQLGVEAKLRTLRTHALQTLSYLSPKQTAPRSIPLPIIETVHTSFAVCDASPLSVR
jgi:hypothetical protein